MARPTKQGVDYFPLDVHLDNKFKFIEIKFGLEGFAVVIKILQEIYAQGYFCDWSDDEKLLFSDEHKIEFEKLDLITNECLVREIFNQELYENYRILTSKGIQERYQEIVKRRKDVEVRTSYLLIDGSFGVNVNTMSTSRKHDDNKSTQSKVKESKVNKSKGKNNSRKQVYDESSLYYKMAEYFYQLILKNNSQHKKPNIQVWSDDFRKLVELDDRNKDEVRQVMEWVQSDDFEMVNVLSPKKLRDRYDNLFMKMNKSSRSNIINLKGGASTSDPRNYDDHVGHHGVQLYK